MKNYIYKKFIQPKDTYFRAGAGIVILNGKNEVLVFERADRPGKFQCSQGGLDIGEHARVGALRELFEETAITEDQLQIIHTVSQWLTYEYPSELAIGETYRGQSQKWYIARLKDEVEIRLEDAHDKEFISYKWINTEYLLEEIISFKRPVYEHLLEVIRRIEHHG